MRLEPKIIVTDNPSEMAQAGARIFMSVAKESVERRGRFSLAVSGGSSPRPLHKLLAQEPCVSEIPWDKTEVFWVDERCIPYDNPDSNYGLAKADFLDLAPIPAEQVHRMPTEISPENGALEYQKEMIDSFKLKENEYPVFDLIFLGIGADGHTASLFPGHDALQEREKPVVPVKGGSPHVYRLTMTLPVLNNAREIVFLASGKGKSDIIRKIFKPGQKELPAQMIQPVNGTLTWLMDREAASLISF